MEVTKDIHVKIEGEVDQGTINRWFKKFQSDCKEARQSGKVW